jgi:hypothetical protein
MKLVNAFCVKARSAFFSKRFIVQRVNTFCTRTHYTIVPVTDLNKYLLIHYGTSGTE